MKVPVVVIFTKSDVLELKLLESLERNGLDDEEIAMRLREPGSTDAFKQVHLQLAGFKYPPKGYLYLESEWFI